MASTNRTRVLALESWGVEELGGDDSLVRESLMGDAEVGHVRDACEWARQHRPIPIDFATFLTNRMGIDNIERVVGRRDKEGLSETESEKIDRAKLLATRLRWRRRWRRSGRCSVSGWTRERCHTACGHMVNGPTSACGPRKLRALCSRCGPGNRVDNMVVSDSFSLQLALKSNTHRSTLAASAWPYEGGLRVGGGSGLWRQRPSVAPLAPGPCGGRRGRGGAGKWGAPNGARVAVFD